MATIIGLKELRENAEAVAERVGQGESFVVVKRSKPIFRLEPMTGQTAPDEELVAWTKSRIKRFEPVLRELADK
jgi:antitoxin (DNA-binding transcriptional repressor) of toxin-antitoxin stability system